MILRINTPRIWLLAGALCAVSHARAQEKRVEISYEINHVAGVSTAGVEFAPAVISETQMVFVSDREYERLNEGENNWKKRKRLNMFMADITKWNLDTVSFGKISLLDPLFVANSHSGPVSFNASGTVAVFNLVQVTPRKAPVSARVQASDRLEWELLEKPGVDKKVKEFKPQIYFSSRDGERWTKPQPFPFNDPNYALAHPAISADGNTLVFAANLPGGSGKTDLYISRKEGDKWTKPELLIQASGPDSELFPSIVNDFIYFASDRSGGFGKLDLYKIPLLGGAPQNLGETINSSADDFSLTLFPGVQAGMFTSNRNGGPGDDDIYFVRVIETAIIESRELSGEFRYRKLGSKAQKMEVLLLDDDGNVVMQTITDENGRFLFRNLSFDDNYTLRLKNPEDNMELVIFNRDGEEIAYLLSNENGEFVYKRLTPADVGTLALIDPEDVDPTVNTGEMNGQFVYEHLKSKYPSGLKVMLVDDEGNVVHETVTDQYGNFSFRNLNMSKNYTLRTEGEEDMTLLIYNKDNKISAMLRMGQDGTYTYRKLKNQYQNNLTIINLEDSLLVDYITASLNGVFSYKKLKQGFGPGLDFQVLDSNGNLLMKGQSDDQGRFALRNLPLLESYLIRVDAEQFALDDMELTITNRFGKKVALLDKDKMGYFVYSPLGLGGGVEITQMENDPTHLNVTFKNGDLPVVYFDKNSSVLAPEAKTLLQNLAKDMKTNPAMKLEVSSYADSRATEEYNLWLSQKRTKSVITYLSSKGIPASRISGNAYGESNLVNECDNEKECPEELHRLNRRAEIRIY
jgi:outer membrane protein OmpA-like peptidoglycan-associated protein/Tol biopolymer transport system component